MFKDKSKLNGLSKKDPIFYREALKILLSEAYINGVTYGIKENKVVFDDRHNGITTTVCSVEFDEYTADKKQNKSISSKCRKFKVICDECEGTGTTESGKCCDWCGGSGIKIVTTYSNDPPLGAFEEIE